MKIEPKETALIIVDMQKGFLDEGAPIFTPNGKSIIPQVKKLISLCRKHSIQIFWSKSHIDLFKQGPYPLLFPKHFDKETGESAMSKKSIYYDIIDELKEDIANNDIIIYKDRYSVFYNTNFDTNLKQLAIKNLIVCGVTTNVCVESTVRDAFTSDYFPFMISDCTATFSEEFQKTAEDIIRFCFGFVLKLNELENKL
ncbi:cysteine hydrolase family protein [Maribellus sediminis]|uniref:cysteine hydrolase family protein n=1 Tax=Maribellus sediminis TaxID=2696285 RepID=UPI001430FA74|nr:isochorismatase family cysteine hydrolase [Maribellus sediminis]